MRFAFLAVLTAVALAGSAEGDLVPLDLQAKIDAAAEGETVRVGPGRWEAKPFRLKSGVTLELAEGAVVFATTNLADYAAREGERTFVSAVDADNVTICGKGVLDGRGFAFRETASERMTAASQPQALPVMMRFTRCKNLRLRDFTYRSCGAWGCHLRNCDGVEMRRVTCFNHVNNTNDGIDIESSNVLIEDCDIDSDDDAVVFKTESDMTFQVTNVVVRNCRLASACNAVKFGTGSYCDFRDVVIENCALGRPRASYRFDRSGQTGRKGVPAGLAGLALEVVDGGRMENVTVRNMSVNGYLTPVFVRLGRRHGPQPGKETYLRNVVIENVSGTADSRLASSITGVPGLLPENIVLRNCTFAFPGGGTSEDAVRAVPERETGYPECTMFGGSLPAWAFYVRHAKGVIFDNVRLTKLGDDARQEVMAEDAPGFVRKTFAAREQIDFDFGWEFGRGAEPAVWADVDLPHDFQFSQPWEKSADAWRGYKAMGEGVYRKRFFADPAWMGKRVSLDFGGILCLSEVSVNGRKLAECDYGYLGFEVPIEGVVRFGATNVVEVKASTGRANGGRWYTGGGLYRSVRLVVRDVVSVSRHGVFVTTPEVTDGRAAVDVQVELDGWTRQTNDLNVAVRLFAPDGAVVGETAAQAPKSSRLKRTLVRLPRICVANPVRWDLTSPALYVAEVTVRRNGCVLDRRNQRFGIRTLDFDPSFGFKLNGRKVFLQSMSNHHDLGALGAAAYRRAIERQVRTMKAFGYNAIRCSHNPYSEDLYEIADELGLLVVDEVADQWGCGWAMGRPLHEAFFGRITEWVRRDRNHPSVILWSLGNETQHQESRFGFAADDWGVTSYRIFDTVVKRWDPTRKTTVAMFPSGANGCTRFEKELTPDDWSAPPELCRVTDVASLNYRPDAYRGFVERVPGLNIFQSEAAVLEGLTPYWLMDRDHAIGLSYWGAIAYWGESGGWPLKGWNYSFFDHDLRPRPTAWQIRTAFLPDEPQVRVAVDEGKEAKMWNDVLVGHHKLVESWNRRRGDVVDLVVFSNAEEAELLLNGRSLGVRLNDSPEPSSRNVLTWKGVAWESGRLEAVARTAAGRVVARHALETTGPAVRLLAVEETDGWGADGKDLKYVRFTAVDEQGRVVPEAEGEVSVSVEGPARLLALDDGNQATDLLFAVPSKPLRNGSILAILRADRKPGLVTVTASAVGRYPACRFLTQTRASCEKSLSDGWEFRRDGERRWESVTIPH